VSTARPSTHNNRVLIIEDHALFAEALELTLSREGYNVRRLELPDQGGSLATLRSAAQRLHPRVVLLDLDLGRFGDGVGLIGPLAQSGANVVVVTASTDRGRWGACVRAGARKVLSKTRPLQETLSTVRRLMQGLPVMSTDELESLLEAWRVERSGLEELNGRLNRLTPREKEVLSQLIGGLTVREIARHSVVSEATVRTQVKSILAKLEVSSQLAAVGLANQVGWRPTTPTPSTRMPQMRHEALPRRP
jgi:DNA-binding NarL/FixJ family response regulator